ncbi:ATP-grasp domain-containing protein [Pseudomonas cyclaminis]|uniref:ATP-grasp domain-containing protein n=1 Tax=Pseudomonas cyclaminis TaxID=2781239 RepID=UPI0038116973
MKINVLVFPAGEVNSVELHSALSACVNIKVFGASSVDRHGPYVFKNYIGGLPRILEPTFFEVFNKLLSDNKIDVVFPTHDSIAEFFSQNQDRIKSKVIVADPDTSKVCRDKFLTYEHFRDESFCPALYKSLDEIPAYPVFIKPSQGQGSVGAAPCFSSTEMETVDFSTYVVSELLPGEELTVDCITDRHGELKLASPRSRQRVMAGISVASETQELTEEIAQIAQKINAKLKFLGLWFFQIKRDASGKFKLLEVATRCAGTMCLTRAKGANLALLSVYSVLGKDIDVIVNDQKLTVDRTLINRYKLDYIYDTVYYDFDDTVTLDGQISLTAVRYLYQCFNEGIKVVLITKHENNIHETLGLYCLHEKLFSEIIHLKPYENKVDHISPGRAIFIDNSFAERKAVAQKYKIPVFDVDAIEVLLDWRL